MVGVALAMLACVPSSQARPAPASGQRPRPVVSMVSPSSGPIAGGTIVTITGSDLRSCEGKPTPTVTFGSNPASSVVVNSSGTSITATSPQGSAGTVDVTVTTAAGRTSAMVPGDEFTYVPAPTVSGVAPSTGPTAGGTSVTIAGTNLTGATAVAFGLNPASSVVVNSPTSITATSPQGSGVVDVTVTTVGEMSATGPGDEFTYVAAPTVSGVAPSTGPTAGGTSVTIAGTNFTGATAVAFGLNPASSFAVNSSGTSITATSPGGPAGTVDVTVTTAGGPSATGAGDQFSYSVMTVVPAVPASVPVVHTAAPVVQGSSGAAFSGTVNPEGLATTAYFEYGLDPKYAGGGAVVYGASTAVQQVGFDLSNHPVSVSVSGLLPNALYHVRLVAMNGDGTTIGPDETFTTAMSAPPPPPVLGKTVNATPVSGLVYIKLPHGKPASDVEVNDALIKGQGFVPLTEPRQLPSGTQIDARGGTLDLIAAPAKKHGKQQMITLSGALIGFSQSRTGLTKGLTTISLLENAFPGAPSYARCPKAQADESLAHAASSSPSSAVVQSLHAKDNHGQFKTRGRYSSATVRGTAWQMSDLCDGTLTSVQRGTVSVFVFATRKTITLHAGHSYLARAIIKRTK